VRRNLLYHYTSVDCLESIITTRVLWATSIRYLNDGEEFNYAVRLLRAEIAAALEKNSRLDAPLNQLADSIRSAQDNVGRGLISAIFVASLSAAGDLLSQWRAYCPDQRGVSVGFSRTRLANAATGFRLVRCIYKQAKQRAVLRDLLSEFTADVTGATDRKQVATAIATTVRKFKQLAPALKHPSFSEEREWRLVGSLLSSGADDLSFRPGRSMLLPYIPVSLPFEDDAIRVERIIVGPTPHPELAANAVVNLLRIRGIRRSPVTNATAPYRSW
jgi:hypothetical protein